MSKEVKTSKLKEEGLNAKTEDKSGFAFGNINFILMGLGIAIVALGFYLMSGGASEDPAKFSEELFSARRITLAPITVLAGFAIILVAIMKKSK